MDRLLLILSFNVSTTESQHLHLPTDMVHNIQAQRKSDQTHLRFNTVENK